jgi:hypothetical protein
VRIARSVRNRVYGVGWPCLWRCQIKETSASKQLAAPLLDTRLRTAVIGSDPAGYLQLFTTPLSLTMKCPLLAPLNVPCLTHSISAAVTVL